MTHGIRTQAATYNEKGVDPEIGIVAFNRGIELFREWATPKSVSKSIDIYSNPAKGGKISINFSLINSRIGVNLEEKEIVSILSNLQFNPKVKGNYLEVLPPSYRSRDINIPEDIVEEIARIYGYHNLPNNIQPTVFVKQPKDLDLLFELQSKIKYFLKHLGLHEVMNYSMVSEKIIQSADLKVEEHLALKNTISEEIKYMRSHILPSLYMNIKNNEGKSDELKFFEIAKTYKKKSNDLPSESYKLGIVVNTSYSDVKGIVDSLLDELSITDFKTKKTDYDFLTKNLQAEISKDDVYIVRIGQMSKKYQSNFAIKKDVFVAVLDFKALMKYYKPIAKYRPINSYAVVKLDRTFENRTYEEIKNQAFKSKLLQKLELVSVFKNKFTLRFYFSSNDRNITEKEAQIELAKLNI